MPVSKQKIRVTLFILILSITSISFTAFTIDQKLIENIYTQTDRPFYFPGETIWFKSYIVDEERKTTELSDAMYAELISPKGTVVKQLKIGIKQGYAYGNFDTNEDWVGGMYTLKVYTYWMKNYGSEAFFTKKIAIQKVIQPEVLLKLKFEKEGYGKGSEVIANFEAKDLKNKPLANKEIAYEVAVKGTKIYTGKVETNQKGKANPTFTLPDNLSTIDAVFTILLPYNGSTESISRSIPIVLDNIDLQFFPESGKIIAKTMNRVAFKALNEFGKPVDVSGDIIDATGTIVANFSSYHDGMGSFELNAKHNMSYYARITAPFTSEKKIKLPKVFDTGLRFNASTDSINTTLELFSTLNQPVQLEVSNISKILWKQEVFKDQKRIVVPTIDFPIGITRFTFFDSQHIPIAERLVFVNAHKKLKIEISTAKENYETREKVEVHIKTTNGKGEPIASNLSIAVADNKLLSFADDKQDNILSYLLMSSELQGKIHKPVFYFDQREPKATKALDYVMLTHGWRNYLDTKKVTRKNALFLPEQEAIQRGVVVDKKGKPIKAHILIFDQKGTKVLVLDTDDKGEYVCKLGKQTSYVMIAYTDDRKPLRIIHRPQELGYNVTKNSAIKEIKDGKMVKGFGSVKKPLPQSIKKKAEAALTLVEDKASLDEVVIIGYGIHERKSAAGCIVKIETKDIVPSGDITQILQGKISGVNIVNADGIYGNSAKISIRGNASISGNNQPLIVVDGVPVGEDTLQNLDPARIESITVLKDVAATALYGAHGANGVLVITSKNKNFVYNWGKKKINNAKYNNYTYHQIYNKNSLTSYTPKQFYIPVYDSRVLPKERTDFRQTIYWNPVVQTDKKGEATLSFYNSDAITSFKITAEGIGYNGLVGRKEKDYSTKKLLYIDFKSPNYMALNDTVQLPITIKNESSDVVKATLHLELPEGIKLLEPIDHNIQIAPNATVLKHIKVVPVAVGKKSRIIASIKTATYSDTVNKEVAVISPYFPTEVSISGSRNESFTFEINSVVKQSLTADFTIYTDIVGDVMNGIESLIRQPYGCFEQTSSSTYPNVLVLKYLKETGKNNPEITSKAMKYIKEGYERLISFETKEGGFEWFGKTPPHETLTAYGILEFTEMKEIYSKVDQKMINRTVTWLMSRRDGEGGFKKSTKGYDSFASSPKEVADAYIVYAISEAGISVELEKEYNTTYNKALQSNDSYRMALLAAASYNLGKDENGNRLIAAIKQNIETYGFKTLPVANTITRSSGNSKSIETAAFTILALMKEHVKDEILISKGIAYLVSQRKGGRFGSTQSTALALKALIEYTKTQKDKLIHQDNVITLAINGKELTKDLKVNNHGQVVIDNLDKYLVEGKQTMNVNFSNPAISFPYEMNIHWESPLPDTSAQCQLTMKTTILDKQYTVGDNVRMTVEVTNTSLQGIGMPMAIVGIPSGTTAQPWQLKELLERKEVAYYEVFENYLVFYWREFDPSEIKTIALDLKADIAGVYQGPASTTYQYYADEYKHWVPGNTIEIGD